MANRNIMGRSLSGIATALTRMQNRMYTAPPSEIAGVSDQSWPNPLQPVLPIGPQGSAPLAFPFWEGQNLTYTPRPDAVYTAAELRELATYPLARILIEQVKDDICSTKWKIQLKKLPGETNKARSQRQANDTQLLALQEFFEYPDGENNWSTWLRPFLEDVLVIDAGCILMQRRFNDKIAKLRVIPGDSIARYVDDNGWTPEYPSPAYAQLWEGIPRLNLTTRQLVYRPYNIVPRNNVSSYMYGMSPTESNATEIKVGIERLQSVLAYYTDGAIPGLIQVIPAGVTPDVVNERVQALNNLLSGDLSARRKWQAVQGYYPVDSPGSKQDQIIETKDPVLADVFDDLHIRKLAFGYGASAQRLLKMMNRASSESNQDAAEQEGTLPWIMYVKNTMDYIIQRQAGQTAYEWVPDTNREPDPETQMTTLTGYVKDGIMEINEAREIIDLDPSSLPEAKGLGVITATGYVPLEGSVDRTNKATENSTTVANKPAAPVAAGAARPASAAKVAHDDWYSSRSY